MKLIVFLFALAFANDRLTRQKVLSEIKQDDGVYELNESNFDLMINWNNIVLVCFYSGSRYF